jgi:hypothetical protein
MNGELCVDCVSIVILVVAILGLLVKTIMLTSMTVVQINLCQNNGTCDDGINSYSSLQLQSWVYR